MDKYIKIKTLFEKNADEDRAESMAHYMRDQFCFYGLSSPKRKTLYKDFLKEEKKRRTIDWELLDRCYADMHREFQYFVCDYLSAMKQYLIYEDIQHIKEYVKSRQWWDTIDCFDRIIGSIGLRDHRVDDLMLEWSVDEDFWLRRLAIDNFRSFFRLHVAPYRRPDLPVGVIGSVGYYFSAELSDAAEAEGITLGTVERSPLERLAAYHG